MSPDPGVEPGPGALPMLARGRHRNPRKGACFMELVSYVAGEPWSDHPRCTHPLLAALARAVNDASSDWARPQLAPLVPAVVGLDGDGEQWSIEIALLAATAALPISSAEKQSALAVGLLTCERMLDAANDGDPRRPRPETLAALDAVPAAEVWARKFLDRSGVVPRRFATSAAPEIVRLSVEGIADACVEDPDRRLRELLESAIIECRTWAGMGPLRVHALDPEVWRAVCRPWSLTS